MADEFLIQVLEGKQSLPWKVVLYGTSGIGKSTLASKAPAPFFLDLENGLREIDAPKTQLLTTYDQFIAGMKFAYESKYKTIIIDTITALEEILAPKAVEAHNSSVEKERLKVKSLAEIGWGKGSDFIAAEWRKMVLGFEKLQAAGKNVLLVGHDKVEAVKDPMYENYERLNMRVDKKSAYVITERSDAVLFAHVPRFVQDKEDGKGKIAKSSGERVIRCIESPSAVAKNRFQMPEVIPMDAKLFELLK